MHISHGCLGRHWVRSEFHAIPLSAPQNSLPMQPDFQSGWPSQPECLFPAPPAPSLLSRNAFAAATGHTYRHICSTNACSPLHRRCTGGRCTSWCPSLSVTAVLSIRMTCAIWSINEASAATVVGSWVTKDHGATERLLPDHYVSWSMNWIKIILSATDGKKQMSACCSWHVVSWSVPSRLALLLDLVKVPTKILEPSIDIIDELRRLLYGLLSVLLGDRVEATRGLIEQHDVALLEYNSGNGEPLPFPVSGLEKDLIRLKQSHNHGTPPMPTLLEYLRHLVTRWHHATKHVIFAFLP